MSSQGKRLQQVRKILNITQDEIGKALDVSKQVISNIEADRVLLNNDKLVSLGKNFNVSLDYILLGRGNMFMKDNFNLCEEKIKYVIKQMIDTGEFGKLITTENKNT